MKRKREGSLVRHRFIKKLSRGQIYYVSSRGVAWVKWPEYKQAHPHALSDLRLILNVSKS